MTSRERVMAALGHRRPDRVPIFDSFWSGFVERWRQEKGFDTSASIVDDYGIDIAICR